jgi:hypothetical protein
MKSSIILAVIILFLILALSDPKQTGGDTFAWLYGELVSLIPTAFRYLAHFYVPFIVFRRVRGVGAILMAVCWLLPTLRSAQLFTYLFPWLNPISDWLMKGVVTTVMRASMLAAACGAVILTARALVGREPGLIELEVT